MRGLSAPRVASRRWEYIDLHEMDLAKIISWQPVGDAS